MESADMIQEAFTAISEESRPNSTVQARIAHTPASPLTRPLSSRYAAVSSISRAQTMMTASTAPPPVTVWLLCRAARLGSAPERMQLTARIAVEDSLAVKASMPSFSAERYAEATGCPSRRRYRAEPPEDARSSLYAATPLPLNTT